MRKALVRMVVAVLAIVMVYTPVYATTTYTSSTKAYYSASKLKRNFGSRTNPKKGTKPVSVPKPAVNGCIYGDFATFNSLASENKLGGTPIYICGTIKSVEKLAATGDIFYGAFMVDDCDGYQWCATMDIPSANFDLVKATYTGKTGYIFGLYNGYSTDMSRPLLDIATIVDASSAATTTNQIPSGANAPQNNIKIAETTSSNNTVSVNSVTGNYIPMADNGGAIIVNASNSEHKVHLRNGCNKQPDEDNRLFFNSLDEAASNGFTNKCKLCFK